MFNIAFSESLIIKSELHEWCKSFQNDSQDVQDDKRPGCQNTSTT